jgi:hypothetical protein
MRPSFAPPVLFPLIVDVPLCVLRDLGLRRLTPPSPASPSGACTPDCGAACPCKRCDKSARRVDAIVDCSWVHIAPVADLDDDYKNVILDLVNDGVRPLTNSVPVFSVHLLATQPARILSEYIKAFQNPRNVLLSFDEGSQILSVLATGRANGIIDEIGHGALGMGRLDA